MGTTWSIFIAYPSSLRVWVDEVYAALPLAVQARTFVAHHANTPGALWGSTIPRAQRQAKVQVIFSAPDGQASAWLADELDRAIEMERHGARLVPIRTGDDLAYGLRAFHVVDMRKVGAQGVVEEILAAEAEVNRAAVSGRSARAGGLTIFSRASTAPAHAPETHADRDAAETPAPTPEPHADRDTAEAPSPDTGRPGADATAWWLGLSAFAVAFIMVGLAIQGPAWSFGETDAEPAPDARYAVAATEGPAPALPAPPPAALNPGVTIAPVDGGRAVTPGTRTASFAAAPPRTGGSIEPTHVTALASDPGNTVVLSGPTLPVGEELYAKDDPNFRCRVSRAQAPLACTVTSTERPKQDALLFAARPKAKYRGSVWAIRELSDPKLQLSPRAPAGLTFVARDGGGWTCVGNPDGTCTRTDRRADAPLQGTVFIAHAR